MIDKNKVGEKRNVPKVIVRLMTILVTRMLVDFTKEYIRNVDLHKDLGMPTDSEETKTLY